MESLRNAAFILTLKLEGKGSKEWGLKKLQWRRSLMIYVNQEQLDQVKYLLDQSALGNHLLFDGKTIHRIASRIGNKDSCADRVEKAEKLLEQMILCPTISSKKNFLEGLDSQTYDDVAHVYFNIVQNSAEEKQGFKH